MSGSHGTGVIEQGSWRSALDSDRIAVIAHWSTQTEATRSIGSLIAQLQGAGFTTALVSTCEVPQPLRFPDGLSPDVVVRRPNLGYDFGSWAHAISAREVGKSNARVLLVNDSLAGPFSSIAHLLESFSQSEGDVWALSCSDQFDWHMQSFFMGFKAGVLGEKPLRRFWSRIRELGSKDRVILEYELGLSRIVRGEGFTVDPFLPPGLVVGHGRNPMIEGWRSVLDSGVPFVKREILRHPELVPEGIRIPQELATRFGVRVEEWV